MYLLKCSFTENRRTPQSSPFHWRFTKDLATFQRFLIFDSAFGIWTSTSAGAHLTPFVFELTTRGLRSLWTNPTSSKVAVLLPHNDDDIMHSPILAYLVPLEARIRHSSCNATPDSHIIQCLPFILSCSPEGDIEVSCGICNVSASNETYDNVCWLSSAPGTLSAYYKSGFVSLIQICWQR